MIETNYMNYKRKNKMKLKMLSEINNIVDEYEFINLTPHAINVQTEDGETLTIEPSGTIARVKMGRRKIGEYNGIPLTELYIQSVEGLPSPQRGIIYIVSGMVASNLKDRNDVVAPDTDAAIRNDKGHIVAVPGFVKYS